MSGNQVKRWLSLLAVVAVAAMIFFFSAQEGDDSAKISKGVTEWVLTTLVPGYAELALAQKLVYVKRVGLLIRKAAHFSEYALLALTIGVHLRCVMKNRGLRRLAVLSWLAATLYAVTDEWHQRFVAGRGPAALDVGIDSAGALVGALVCAALILLYQRIKDRRNRLA